LETVATPTADKNEADGVDIDSLWRQYARRKLSEMSPMTIHEKIDRLTKLANRRAVSKAAGLGSSTLGTILRRKAGITTTTATALARVLGIEVGWLVDDSQGWPPVRKEADAQEPVAA
jgi:hypothetical protein